MYCMNFSDLDTSKLITDVAGPNGTLHSGYTKDLFEKYNAVCKQVYVEGNAIGMGFFFVNKDDYLRFKEKFQK